MSAIVSIAIETSCRRGTVALGLDGRPADGIELGQARRHAQMLLPAMDDLLKRNRLRCQDLAELYVSVGPGSFTGLRVGVTVARTLGQLLENLKLVAVPTPLVIAENVLDEPWETLGVVLAAKRDPAPSAHVTWIRRPTGAAEIVEPGGIESPEEILARAAETDALLVGEGLGFLDAPATGRQIEPDRAYPTANGVLAVGVRLARAGQFTPYAELLPLYARRPEALRLWEARNQ